MNRSLLLLDMIADAYERIESNPNHLEYVKQQLKKAKDWETEIYNMDLSIEHKRYCKEFIEGIKYFTKEVAK